jgi:hypothetical protein
MARKKETKEVLVGILIRKSSLEILKTESWYHIPIEKARKEWPPQILAFYQGYPFGDEAFQIRYFGEVDQIEIVPRKELFPNDLGFNLLVQQTVPRIPQKVCRNQGIFLDAD